MAKRNRKCRTAILRLANAEDLALIIYTSGTTGKPKGAMLSHQNLMCNVAAVMEAVDIRPDDRMAVLLPMFHSFTMTVGLLLPITQGVSIIAIKSLHPPKILSPRSCNTGRPSCPQSRSFTGRW